MCLADSHIFTYSILQYYHKVLIIGTLFIIVLSYDNWSPARLRLCPQESFPLHFYWFSKFYIIKLETCCALCTKYLVKPCTTYLKAIAQIPYWYPRIICPHFLLLHAYPACISDAIFIPPTSTKLEREYIGFILSVCLSVFGQNCVCSVT